MKKKLISAILALVMVIGLLPLSAFADTSLADNDAGANGSPVESNALTQNKYVTSTGEGVAEDGGQYYTVRGWLTFINMEQAGFSNGSDTLTITAANVGALNNAVYNLRGAVKANENSTDAVKATLATEIEKYTSRFAAIKTLSMKGLTTNSLGVLQGVAEDKTDTFFTGLETLDYSGSKLPASAEGAEGVLPELKVWDTVKVLNLSNCDLTDANVLAGATQLTKLDLSGNAGLDNINYLAGVNSGDEANPVFNAPLASLTTLDISDTAVSNLASLVHCTKLTSLTAKNLKEKLTGSNPYYPLQKLVETDGVKLTTLDLTGSIKDDLTNTDKAVLKAIKTKAAGATGLPEDSALAPTITAKLTALSVKNGTDVLTLTPAFAEATTEYAVKVPEDMDTVTIETTVPGGFEITKVLYGATEQPDVNTALTNVKVSTSFDVHIVVRPTNGLNTDPENYRVYTVHLQKEGAVAGSFVTVTADAGVIEIKKNGQVIDAADVQEGDTISVSVKPGDKVVSYFDIVYNGDGKNPTFTKVDANTLTYTFKVDKAVTITATLVEKPTIAYERVTDGKEFYEGKLTVSGLDGSKTYVVTYENGVATKINGKNVVPRLSHVVTGETSVELSCAPTNKIMVFELHGDNLNAEGALYPIYGKTNGSGIITGGADLPTQP